MRAVRPIAEAAELVKFVHTAFALPFALIAALAAARGLPRWPVVGWILLAMVGARTAAMAFNRLADHAIDAANPRTADRALASGRLPRSFAWALVAGGCAALLLAAWRLNPLCLALSPLALAWVLGYSYSKRFTTLSHLWLGLGLGIAPVGAWLAVRGAFGVPPFVLALAVTAWVAGFDVLYSLQDEHFDRDAGLHSIPARFGGRRALAMSAGAHVVTVAALVGCGLALHRGLAYAVAVAVVAVLLAYEHTIVHRRGLAAIDRAFFDVNAWVSVAFFTLVLADEALRRLLAH